MTNAEMNRRLATVRFDTRIHALSLIGDGNSVRAVARETKLPLRVVTALFQFKVQNDRNVDAMLREMGF